MPQDPQYPTRLRLGSEDRFRRIWEEATETQKRFILELERTEAVKLAAKAVGVHQRTPYAWDNIDDLRLAADLISTPLLHRIQERAEELAHPVMDKLLELIDSSDESITIRAVEAYIKLLRAIDVTPSQQTKGEQVNQQINVTLTSAKGKDRPAGKDVSAHIEDA